MELEDYEDYLQVDHPEDLAGPGRRIWRPKLPDYFTASPPRSVAGVPAKLLPLPTVRPAFHVVKAVNVVCLPGRVIYDPERQRILRDSLRRPDSTVPPTPWLPTAPHAPIDFQGLEVQSFKRPVHYANTRHSGYGHVMLEGLSQLWASRSLAFLSPRLVGCQAFAGMLSPMAAAVGAPALSQIAGKRQAFACEQLYVASQSYVLDYGVFQPCLDMADIIRRHHAEDVRQERKLYVSRRKAASRPLREIDEVEAVFRQEGFEIFHPEDHPVVEQIRRFAGAKVVAGPVGSGLYNALFCHHGTERLVLASRFYTTNDSILSAVTGHEPHYVFGQTLGTERAQTAPWTIDVDVVRATLKGLAL